MPFTGFVSLVSVENITVRLQIHKYFSTLQYLPIAHSSHLKSTHDISCTALSKFPFLFTNKHQYM